MPCKRLSFLGCFTSSLPRLSSDSSKLFVTCFLYFSIPISCFNQVLHGMETRRRLAFLPFVLKFNYFQPSST
jgi:hypothetical protein